FEPEWVLALRSRLVAAAGAAACLVVVDDFAAVGVPRAADLGPGRYVLDHEYDLVRLRRLEWLRQATAAPGRPGGDPLLVVAGVRKQPDGERLDQVRGHSQLVEAAGCVLF